MPKNYKPELIKGSKYNRLTVIEYCYSDIRWRKFYKTKCDCGNERIIMGSAMISGNTKSCGCLGIEIKKSKRISENHSEITAIILGYKRHAIDRGFKWNLSRDFIIELIKKNCFYCGNPPSNKKLTKNSLGKGLFYSGIDRIDSKKDYFANNVVPCCKICNYAKSNLTITQFRDWATKLGKRAMADQWGSY